MSFGKPKRTTEEVRCLQCGDRYRDRDTILKYAGRTVRGDYWNDKCPSCGAYNLMSEEIAQMDETEYQKQKENIQA